LSPSITSTIGDDVCRIGTLERLDLRGTGIRPRDFVDCLWSIASHPGRCQWQSIRPQQPPTPQHLLQPQPADLGNNNNNNNNNNDNDNDNNDSDERYLWCWVCFKSLLLEPEASAETKDIHDDSSTSTSTCTPSSWTRQDLGRLETLLAMDELEELYLGEGLQLVSKGKRRHQQDWKHLL